jgi:Tol biopolymer transport system component
MKAIDHHKAHRLIQAALSLPLSEKDRGYLDIHLDDCEKCREYGGQLAELETNLRQSLHARWDHVSAPPIGLTYAVPEKLGAGLASQRLIGYGGAVVSAIIFVALLIVAISMIPERVFPLAQNQTSVAPEGSSSLSKTLSTTEQSILPAGTENIPGENIFAPTTTPSLEEFVPVSFPDDFYPGMIAFTSYRDGNGEIYVMHPDEGWIQNLTNDSAVDYHPEWSLDGRRLAFISLRKNGAQIFTIDLESGRLTQLTQSSQVKSVNFCSNTTPVSLGARDGFIDPAWSPDGKYLVASLAMNIKGNMFEPLYLIHSDGSSATQLTMGNDINPQWSPDGKMIAFNRLADCEGGGHDIYAIQADGSGLANLTSSEASEDGAFAWSPDGSLIAYFSTSVGNEGPGRTALMLMDANGSNPVALSDLGPRKKYPGSLAWSPDGKRLAYVPPHESNEAHIYMIDRDGSNRERLIVPADHYFDLSWSPDGDWLAYASGLDEPAIYALNVGSTDQPLEGKTSVRILPPGGQYTRPRWQPAAARTIPHTNQLETLVEADLNCGGNRERILAEPGDQLHYFNNNPTYVRVLLETVSGQNTEPVWEYSAQDANVAYLTPKIIHMGECQGFLAILGDEGPGSGLRVFHWNGEEMKEALHIPGRYLFAEPEELEGMRITAPSDSLSIMSLLQSDTKNLWVVRVFEWDGSEFKQIIQEEVRYPAGG